MNPPNKTLVVEKANVKPRPVMRTIDEMFQTGRYHPWKKGEVTSPRWLARDNGFDYIKLNSPQDMQDFEKYLARARADIRLAVESYNSFTTGRDKNSNPMLVLNEVDALSGDTTKRAIVVLINHELAEAAVALVDHFCAIQ